MRLNVCRVMAASLSVHLTAGADAAGFAGAISFWWGCSRNGSGERDTASKFAGQRWKWVRCRDAGPIGAIQRNVFGSGYQLHARDFSTYRNRALDDQLAMFEL